MNKIESINLIYRNPEIRGGRPCIVGTSLRVLDIVNAMRWNGRSPEQMADAYQVSLAKIHAALAYYYENQDEIDADIREDQRRSEEIAARVLAVKSSFSSRFSRYMQDAQFRSAIDEALEASNERRPALIRDLFDKMQAAELEGSGEFRGDETKPPSPAPCPQNEGRGVFQRLIVLKPLPHFGGGVWGGGKLNTSPRNSPISGGPDMTLLRQFKVQCEIPQLARSGP